MTVLGSSPIPDNASPPAIPDSVLLDDAGLLMVDAVCMRCRYNLRSMRPDGNCPECGESVALSLAEAARRGGPDDLTLGHMTYLGRTCYLLAGVVWPLFCFGLSFSRPVMGPDWQSGRLYDYIKLLLGGPPTWVFYPWLLFAMTSLALIVLRPARFGGSRWLRFGVYSGILLAIQYHVIEAVTVGDSLLGTVLMITIPLAVTAGVVAGVAGFCRIRKQRFRPKTRAIVGWIAFCLGLPILVFSPGIVVLMITAPCWTLAAYVLLTIRLLRSSEKGARRTPWWAWPIWLGGWGASWGGAIHLMLIEYSKLPLTKPDCYVSTVAARGHPWIVGSEEARVSHTVTIRVNDQMRRLKAAELVLSVILPHCHRFCRRVYNFLGPKLARRLNHPLLADVAYLTLKPLEWMCMGMLRLVAPGANALTKSLYRGPQGMKV